MADNEERTKAPGYQNPISQLIADEEDVEGQATYIQRSDLTISSTYNIVNKYINNMGVVRYVQREIGQNANGDVVYVKITLVSSTCPSWAVSLDI